MDRYSKGGGNAINLSDSLDYIRVPEITGVEALCVNINICSIWRTVCAFYRPPSSSAEVFVRLDVCIALHRRLNSKLIFGVNFNMSNINWASPNSTYMYSKALLDLMFRHYLSQAACEPTRITEHFDSILDLLFVSQDIVDNLSQLIVHEGISDHKMISFSMLVHGRRKQHKRKIEC